VDNLNIDLNVKLKIALGVIENLKDLKIKYENLIDLNFRSAQSIDIKNSQHTNTFKPFQNSDLNRMSDL
jgi:hypothetical protein